MLAPEGGKRGRTPSVHEAAAHGISGAAGKLPDADKIQQSFGGYDISNVQAHTSSAAHEASRAMGADAYATGNHVVLGAGGADLHTQAHEAAHVVQQKQGVSLSGGVGKAGDVYEKHADQVADLVVEGESAEGLLGQVAAGGGGGASVQKQEAESDTTKETGPPGSESNPIELTCPLYVVDALLHMEKRMISAKTASSNFNTFARKAAKALQLAANSANTLKASRDQTYVEINAANSAIRTRQAVAAVSNIGHVFGTVSSGMSVLSAMLTKSSGQNLQNALKTIMSLNSMSGIVKNVAGTYAALDNGEKSKGAGPANAEMKAIEAVQGHNDIQDQVIVGSAFDTAFDHLSGAIGAGETMDAELRCAADHASLLKEPDPARVLQTEDDFVAIGVNMNEGGEALIASRAPTRAAAAGTPHLAAQENASRPLVEWVVDNESNAKSIVVEKIEYKQILIRGETLISGPSSFRATTSNPEAIKILEGTPRVLLDPTSGPGTFLLPRDLGTFLAANCTSKIIDGGINAFHDVNGRVFEVRPRLTESQYLRSPAQQRHAMGQSAHFGAVTPFRDSGY